MRGEQGACGDYTDLTRLRYAYTTHLAQSGKALMPPAAGGGGGPAGGLDTSAGRAAEEGLGPVPPRLSASTISMLQDAAADGDAAAAGMLGGGGVPFVPTALSNMSLVGSETTAATSTAGAGQVKIRVPSYTDRIW